VRQAVLKAVAEHPSVATDPPPVLFFMGNGDTSHLFQLAIWFEDPMKTLPITSEVYFLIFDEFSRLGIKPSTPQRNLQIQSQPINSLTPIDPPNILEPAVQI